MCFIRAFAATAFTIDVHGPRPSSMYTAEVPATKSLANPSVFLTTSSIDCRFSRLPNILPTNKSIRSASDATPTARHSRLVPSERGVTRAVILACSDRYSFLNWSMKNRYAISSSSDTRPAGCWSVRAIRLTTRLIMSPTVMYSGETVGAAVTIDGPSESSSEADRPRGVKLSI